MKKLLFSRETPCLQPLRASVERQTHKALVLWALEGAVPYLESFEKARPNDPRPRAVLKAANQWARGQIKMPEAKQAIHAAHNAAAAVGDATRHDAAVMAAARAVAQAASAVHVETHALGLVFYGLTAKSYAAQDPPSADAAVRAELARLTRRLHHWEEAARQAPGPWAPFLQDETRPNKEALLRQKAQK